MIFNRKNIQIFKNTSTTISLILKIKKTFQIANFIQDF